MDDIIAAVIFASWVVAGACGVVALVFVYLKRPLKPVLTVFSICVLISFAAMLLLAGDGGAILDSSSVER